MPSRKPPSAKPLLPKPPIPETEAITSKKLPALDLSINWSREATLFLNEVGVSKPKVNAVVKAALKVALTATPVYPELKKRLGDEQSPVFALDFFFENDARVQELNKTHRRRDKPTDVLSFPLFEGEVFLFPGEMQDEAHMLGDMVISVETAWRQADELKHDMESEIAFLTIHGALHLLGYDHANDKGRRQMFALQDQLFEVFKQSAFSGRKVKARATSA